MPLALHQAVSEGRYKDGRTKLSVELFYFSLMTPSVSIASLLRKYSIVTETVFMGGMSSIREEKINYNG